MTPPCETARAKCRCSGNGILGKPQGRTASLCGPASDLGPMRTTRCGLRSIAATLGCRTQHGGRAIHPRTALLQRPGSQGPSGAAVQFQKTKKRGPGLSFGQHRAAASAGFTPFVPSGTNRAGGNGSAAALRVGYRPVVLTTYLGSGVRHPHLERRRGSSIVVSQPRDPASPPRASDQDKEAPCSGRRGIGPTPVPL
jgi:hypothetical protein